MNYSVLILIIIIVTISTTSNWLNSSIMAKATTLSPAMIKGLKWLRLLVLFLTCWAIGIVTLVAPPLIK